MNYDNYISWKSWDSFGHYDCMLDEYYALELKENISVDSKVLEIGFGSGSLLNWLIDQGCNVHGTEINPDLISLAKESNIKLLNFSDPSLTGYEDYFDTIIAFDVLEHLTSNEIALLLDQISFLLKKGGSFIFKVPNCSSPLGNITFFSDLTHKTPFSQEVIKQLFSSQSALKIQSINNESVPVGKRCGKLSKTLLKYIQKSLQKALLRLFSIVWGVKSPLGVNIVCTAVNKK